MGPRRLFAIAAPAVALMMPFEGAAATNAAKAARCHQLYSLMNRYVGEAVPHHNSGARARSDVADAMCSSGDYDRGIADLEAELTHARIPLPKQN